MHIKNYFSLFSGIGGFELGIQRAWEKICDVNRGQNRRGQKDKTRVKRSGLQPPQGKDACASKGSTCECTNDFSYERPLCVGYSEVDKYAIQTYQRHFPDHRNFGDITAINERGLPDFDLLVGGFPCQSFSIAGKRGGFNDTRGTLFFEIARIAGEKQPRLLLLENVKGLLSHDKGQTFHTIISTLDELGYDCGWQVLNSKDFGVPQNRERVFIAGHLRGTPRPEIFPFGDRDKEIAVIQGQSTNTLTARYEAAQTTGSYIVESELNAQEVVVGTLRTHNDGKGFRKIKSGISPTIPARAREDGSGQPMLNKSGVIRRLTPIECERLQGFPDGWTEGISDAQRYKCLGNAVTVNVIQAIASRMFQVLL